LSRFFPGPVRPDQFRALWDIEGYRRLVPSRVAVVGCSGSGKTTVARRVADRLGLEHVELDALAHQPGWTMRPAEEFRSDLERRLSGAEQGWVTCGHYRRMVGDMHLDQADTIVWLDLPRRTVMTRVIRRTIRRVLTREELWNGNRKSWTNLYHWDPERNIIRWSWVTNKGRREQYEQCMSDGSWVHANVLRLRSPQAVEGFCASLVTAAQ